MLVKEKRHYLYLLLAAFALLGILCVGSNAWKAEASAPLPALDLVFMIDESGSMGGDIADVKNNVNFIATQLGATTDPRFALVGFGAFAGHGGVADGDPHTHTNFTDAPGLAAALTGMIASGGREPGVAATIHAMNNVTGYRAGAGVCALLITDEDSDTPNDLAAANAALDARSAIWYGVVWPGAGNTATMYGPNAGSMSAHTGGAVWPINDFRADPQPVLDAILANCVGQVLTGIVLSQASDTNSVGTDHTVYATVTTSGGTPVAGEEVTIQVISGPNASTSCTGMTDAAGMLSCTYTGAGGVGVDELQGSFIDDQGARIVSRIIEKSWCDICPVQYQYGAPAPGYDMSAWPIFTSWLEVKFRNNGPHNMNNAVATISCAPANVTVVDGTVNLGTIPMGGSAWSSDTFTLSLDMANPQGPNKGIIWDVSYTDDSGGQHVLRGVPKFCGESTTGLCP
jgi:hypothetical protein